MVSFVPQTGAVRVVVRLSYVKNSSGGIDYVPATVTGLWYDRYSCVSGTVLTKVQAKGGRDAYRFGFNGQEKDNEVKGIGNSLNYKARMYDPRIARFNSVDPFASKYPYLTPYQFAGNNPIKFIDRDGLEPAENPNTLQQVNPQFYPQGVVSLVHATDVQTGKPRDFWIFQRELPHQQGHEYSWHTGSGGAAGWKPFWNDAQVAADRRTGFDGFNKAMEYGIKGGLYGSVAAVGLAATGGGAALMRAGSWAVRNYGKSFLQEMAKEALANRGNLESMDINDVLSSTITSRMGVGRKAVGALWNAMNDYSMSKGREFGIFGEKDAGRMVLDGTAETLKLWTGSVGENVGSSEGAVDAVGVTVDQAKKEVSDTYENSITR